MERLARNFTPSRALETSRHFDTCKKHGKSIEIFRFQDEDGYEDDI